jgi:cardiolipin synthase (CMP-forming)
MNDGIGGDKAKDLRSDIITVPNLLSIFRILLVPIFLWSLLKGMSLEALLIFFLAGLTDLLDGFTARVWHQRSKLGMVLDPAGDKLLMATSYVILTLPLVAKPNAIPLWLTVVVFARDLLIVTGALIAFLSWGEKTFAPSILGKITTVGQVGTVFLVLLLNYLGVSPWYMIWIYRLTLLVTLASGTHYFVYGLATLRRHRRIGR